MIVSQARAHLEEARKLPQLVHDGLQSRWLPIQQQMYDAAQTLNDPVAVLHHAQSKVPFDHRQQVHDAVYDLYLALLYDEFPGYRLEFGDNPKSIPNTITGRGGHFVSNIFLWHLRSHLFCRKHVNPETVLEIGGGYGTQARMWLKSGIKRYVIVDLPESLFFAEVALRDEGFDVAYWPDQARVTLIPVSRLDEYTEPSGLVINIGSMGEMSDAWVLHYMRWLDRYPARFFYSLNYMATPYIQLFEGRAMWVPRPSNKWATRSINPAPPLTKIMCAERGFAEILYEKDEHETRLSDWSVFRGRLLDRGTFIEGLELLRQNFSEQNAKVFTNITATHAKADRFIFTKEMFQIASEVMPELYEQLPKNSAVCP